MLSLAFINNLKLCLKIYSFEIKLNKYKTSNQSDKLDSIITRFIIGNKFGNLISNLSAYVTCKKYNP